MIYFWSLLLLSLFFLKPRQPGKHKLYSKENQNNGQKGALDIESE
jgi:hypothetical protein